MRFVVYLVNKIEEGNKNKREFDQSLLWKNLTMK